MSKKTSQYWAKAPAKDIANEILAKVTEHEKWMSDTGYGATVQKMYDTFYAQKDGGFDLHISADGSSAKVSVNHFKSLIERSAALATQSKLQYVARSRNSDAASQMQADFARGLLESYSDDKDMDVITRDMVKYGLICLDSYIYAPWDEHQGEVVARADGLQELRNGDQAFYLLNRFSVASHPVLEKTPYYIVKLPVNKYDLAALYPEQSDKILSFGGDEHTQISNAYLQTPFNSPDINTDDIVFVYHLLHDRTPALPKGRYTLICGTEVLKDTALPYKTLPVVPFCGGKMQGTVAGDSIGTSLAGLQTTYDTIMSSNVTNNLHYNKQSVFSPQEIEIKALSEGFQLIVPANPALPSSPPVAVQLTQSSPESYKLLEGIEASMQTLSGVNSVTRGNPEASLKSGNSLALMLSVAVMSVDDVQKNWVKACAALGTIVIHNLQKFATEPRLAFIGGVSKQAFVKEFKNTDINMIDRITIDVGNPLLSNLGGRYEMVQQWMQFGVTKDPKKIVEFLRTGQVDSLTEDQFKDTLLIRSENEMIRKGEKPEAVMFDNHDQHIIEHRQLANDPLIRNNPVIMRALLAHEMHHIKLRKMMDPDLAAILQLQPLPSQMQPPAPPAGGAQGPAEMMGQNLPNLPPGTPEQAEEAYDMATEQLPPEFNEEEEGMM